MTIRLVSVPILVLLATVVAGHATPAGAQLRMWTSVGSAGTVDEADAALASFNGAVASVKSTKTGTLNIRYNVVAVDGLFGGDGIYLLMRFRDTGAGARVVARLKRVNLATGVTTTLLTADSDAVAGNPDFQVGEVSNCSGGPDFFANAYFVDVEITKTSETANPGLGALQVGLTIC